MKNDISKEQIVKLLNFFINKIEANNFDFHQIENIDYYWDIVNSEKLYNPYEQEIQNDISLGQISEDWENLTKLMNGETKRDIISYDFKLLSVIIRLLEIDNTIDPIITIKDIFNNNISFDAIKLLAGYLRKYEPILSKKIYLKYNDTMFKYLLMTWDIDQIKIFNQYQNKIEKYNQWKIENKEKYDETMKELNIIIDKL